MLALWRKSKYKPRQCIEKQRHYFAYKGLHSQSYGLSSSHVQMWELDVKKAEHQIWYFRIVVLDKTLESPLDSKEIKLVNPKGNQPWIFTGRTNAKAEALITWPPDVKKWLIGKNPEAGEDWGQEKKGSPEDGWMACVWANSGRQWRTGKPGVLQSKGLQTVGHDRATQQETTAGRA